MEVKNGFRLRMYAVECYVCRKLYFTRLVIYIQEMFTIMCYRMFRSIIVVFLLMVSGTTFGQDRTGAVFVAPINYEYYEGNWTSLPNFDKLEPKATGTTDSISDKVAVRRDFFGLRFSGLLDIDRKGEYLFVLESDDGSRIYLDGELLIDNDGLHSSQIERKSIILSAGKHRFVIEYFENSGGNTLGVKVEGPVPVISPLPTSPHGGNILWYQKPAIDWNSSLPVGNGRLGAMVFGDVAQERIQLNDDTLWDGYCRDRNNPRALEGLKKVRELLFAGKNKEATDVANATMLGVPPRINSYQTLGDLHITNSLTDDAKIENYQRSLDLGSAIATTVWQVEGVKFRREVFVSPIDDVCVVRITADKPGMISNTITLSRPADAKCVSDAKDRYRIKLVGQINRPHSETGVNVGMKFESQLIALVKGGRTSNSGGIIDIEKADSVTLLLAAGTNYRGGNPEQICCDTLAKARTKSLDKMKQEDRKSVV